MSFDEVGEKIFEYKRMVWSISYVRVFRYRYYESRCEKIFYTLGWDDCVDSIFKNIFSVLVDVFSLYYSKYREKKRKKKTHKNMKMTKKSNKNRNRHKTMKKHKQKYPIKYIPKRLSNTSRKIASKELEKSRKMYKKGVYYTRKKIPGYKSKESNHVTRAKRLYGIDTIKPSTELARKTGCSVSALEKIVNKGAGAYFSSGSRPNQTGISWGIARLASAISGGKSAVVDFHILSDGCDTQGLAYKLALESRKKHGYGTRRVPKTLV
jgi:hypothetical protein